MISPRCEAVERMANAEYLMLDAVVLQASGILQAYFINTSDSRVPPAIMAMVIHRSVFALSRT